MMVHAFNPNTWEIEVKKKNSTSLRPVLSTEQLPGQPGLHRETYLKNNTPFSMPPQNCNPYLESGERSFQKISSQYRQDRQDQTSASLMLDFAIMQSQSEQKEMFLANGTNIISVIHPT